jgi:hypothetical protein
MGEERWLMENVESDQERRGGNRGWRGGRRVGRGRGRCGRRKNGMGGMVAWSAESIRGSN